MIKVYTRRRAHKWSSWYLEKKEGKRRRKKMTGSHIVMAPFIRTLKSIYIFLGFLYSFFFFFHKAVYEKGKWWLKGGDKILPGILCVFKTFSIFLVLPSLSTFFVACFSLFFFNVLLSIRFGYFTHLILICLKVKGWILFV